MLHLRREGAVSTVKPLHKKAIDISVPQNTECFCQLSHIIFFTCIKYLCMTPCLTNSGSVLSLGQSGTNKCEEMTVKLIHRLYRTVQVKLGWVEFAIYCGSTCLRIGFPLQSKPIYMGICWRSAHGPAGLQTFLLVNWTVNLLPNSNF